MCDTCDWEVYKDDIEMAIDDVSDRSYLESVLEWITDHEHITLAQSEGVERWLDKIR